MITFIFFIGDIALRSTFVLALVFVLLALMRRASASERHLVLVLGLFVVALIPAGQLLSPKILWTFYLPSPPPIEMIVPSTAIPVQTTGEASGPITSAPAVKEPQPVLAQMTFCGALGLLLATGTAAQIFLLGRAAWSWRKIRRHAVLAELPRAAMERAQTFAGSRGVPPILASDRITVPLLAGWRRPAIILPTGARDWPVARLAMVLCHEIAHFLRGDTLLLPFIALIRVLYWWHPLVWHALTLLRRERENACDDLVLNQNFRATDYADLIVETARQARTDSAWQTAALAMASSSNISGRISAILDPSMRRRPAGRAMIFSGAVFALAFGWLLVATQIKAEDTTATPVPKADPGPGIQIEVKLMGFDEAIYPKQSAGIDEALKKGDLAQLLDKVHGMSGASVLSAPNVTTEPGLRATIEMVHEGPLPGQNPVNKNSTVNCGYSGEFMPTWTAGGNILLQSTNKLTEYEGLIKETGQPIFNVTQEAHSEEFKDGETKAYWFEGRYRLNDIGKNDAFTPDTADQPHQKVAVLITVRMDPKARRDKLNKKLETTMIKDVDFKDVTADKFLQFLQEASKASDPEHEGVNFVLKLNEAQGSPPYPMVPVTLKMKDSTLKEALDAFTKQAKLEYSVEDYAVYLKPIGLDAEVFSPRTYLVPNGFFTFSIAGVAADAQIDVKDQLIAKGIVFTRDSTAIYLPASKKLIVRNTAEQLDKIVGLIEAAVPPKPATKFTISLVNIDEKAYEQESQAMDDAVAKGDLDFFVNRKDLFRTANLILLAKQKGWYSEGTIDSYVGSVTREMKEGKLVPVEQSKSVFLGLNAAFTWSADGLLMTSTWSVTEPVSQDKLAGGTVVPLADATNLPTVPLIHVASVTDKDWDMAPGKVHGFWVGQTEGFVKRFVLWGQGKGAGGSLDEMIKANSPSRLAVFLTAEPVKN